jgi:hypothetical protein
MAGVRSSSKGLAASGTPTLDKLGDDFAGCDVVVHLLGNRARALASPRSVEALTSICPDLGGEERP